MPGPVMTLAEIETLMDAHFRGWRLFSAIESVGERDLTVKMPFRAELTRAGGTISGPAMMMLADTAAYYLTLAHAGPVLTAATANLDIHFLSRPAPTEVIARALLLRLGKRLCVSRVEMTSQGELVAHATVTYALPPKS
jgi:uncharacterized protein (TIGR00369 family)